MTPEMNRRGFLRTSAATGLGIALGESELRALPFEPRVLPRRERRPLETVRMGFVGVGNQGIGHVRNFARIPKVEIKAIVDKKADYAERARRWLVENGYPEPRVYTGEEDYLRLAGEEDLDLIFTSTPWALHAPVLRAALENGKHGATEVPLGVSVDELWELVELSERTGLHCVMMENCCYDRTEMMVLNMVRQGVFGELLHAECGYLHDLRGLKLSPDYYVDQWRLKHSITRNGDLYPTHGIGPVAQCFNINRGNQIEYAVSMGSQSRGLPAWAAEHIGENSQEALQQYALSDVVTTLMQTTAGQTILVTHDTNTPRPYSRKYLIQGTRGLYRKYPEEKAYIEGREDNHRWTEGQSYREEFEHPIWKALEEEARGAGHGGMDYIEDYRLIQTLLAGEPPDFDVYDAATWTAVITSSEESIAKRGQPVAFPDFTRGAWPTREPLGIVTI